MYIIIGYLQTRVSNILYSIPKYIQKNKILYTVKMYILVKILYCGCRKLEKTQQTCSSFTFLIRPPNLEFIN